MDKIHYFAAGINSNAEHRLCHKAELTGIVSIKLIISADPLIVGKDRNGNDSGYLINIIQKIITNCLILIE